MGVHLYPPGPKGHPILGCLPEIRQDPLAFLTSCAHTYGDIVHYQVVRAQVFLLNHPDYIETVLSKNSRNFVKGRVYQANQRLLGDGLLTSEGEDWKNQRRRLQPAFHHEQIATYSQQIVELTEQMLGGWGDGEIHDIYQEMKRLTLRIVARVLFDADLSQQAGEIGQALEAVWEQFTARINSGLLIPEQIPTPGNLRLRRAIERLEGIVYQIIRERRVRQHHGQDLLSRLMEGNDGPGPQLSDRQLRDEVMTFLIAGHDTTALTLTWTLFLLSQHTQAETDLRGILQSSPAEHATNKSEPTGPDYAERLVKEALRIYPTVWGISRVALKDCEIGGYTIPAGASVVMSQWVMHHDERYFENPARFDPERWQAEEASRLPRYAYFPFGGGPRGCIGHSFAMLEAGLILTTLIRRFHLELVPDHPVVPYPSFTLYPKFGMKMVIHTLTHPA
jgi:cytochrome P450